MMEHKRLEPDGLAAARLFIDRLRDLRDSLIWLFDALEPDPDAEPDADDEANADEEPSLGSTEDHEHWSAGGAADLEHAAD